MKQNSIGKLIQDSVNHEKEIRKIIAYFVGLMKTMAKHTTMTEEQIENLAIDMDGGYIYGMDILDIIQENSLDNIKT